MFHYEQYDHAGQIPFAEWREKGIKVPIFDVDGTLRGVNQPGIAEAVVRDLEEQDFSSIYSQAALASNNHDPEDIHLFGSLLASRLEIEVFAVCCAEGYRPKPNADMGLVIAEHFEAEPDELGVVGDRRLTDVRFGHKLGAGAIALCNRVGSHDAKWVPALRVLEAGIIGLERAMGMAHRPVPDVVMAGEAASS